MAAQPPPLDRQAAALFGSFFKGLEADVDGWLENLETESLRQARQAWPSPGPAHPYATGRSRRALRARRTGLTVEVSSQDPAASLIETGTTRRGPGTANPWRRAGGRPYLASAVSQTLDVMFEKLRRRVRG